jgi:hypothetical protein
VHLARQGLLLRECTIVHTTLIAAPPWIPPLTQPSNKNHGRARGSAMHQIRKGNQSMKAFGSGETPASASFNNPTVEG